MTTGRRTLVGAAIGLMFVALCVAVFLAYLNPHLAVDLANGVRACF